MVQIRIKTCQQNIYSIDIKGHANYDIFGKDIVCAGIGSIGVGLLNAIDIMMENSCEIKLAKNRIYIEVIHDSEKLQVILNTGIIQLKTIAERYSNYVNIETVEEKV